MKNLKISKELIKAVLQNETEILSKDFNFTINEDYIEFSDDGEMQFEYCIYKFAFKCKEWALSKGYIINSGVTTSNDWCCTIYKIIKENPYIKELSHTWEQSEPEAILKACIWILENKDNK